MSHLPTLPDTAPILQELASIVGPNANDSEPDVLDLFVRSKHIMRHVNDVVKAHKDATIHARAEMDAVLLVLQNLLYEKRHVEREITRCQDFGYVGTPLCLWFSKDITQYQTSRFLILICDGEKVDIPRHPLTLCGRVPQTRTTGNVSPRDYEE